MALDINGNIISSTDITSVGVFKTEVNRDGLICYLDAADKNSYPGSGTVWYDLTGNGYSGTLSNSPTFSSTNGGNFNFNGSNQKIDVPITGNPTCYCFEIGIKQWQAVSPNTSMSPNFSCVGITSNGYSTAGLNIGEWTGGLVNETISWWYSTTTDKASAIVNTITFNYHIYTINWEAANACYTIYLDGVRYSSIAHSNGHTPLITNITNISIGYNIGWSYWFKGDIGFLRMYNRELSSYEIAENFQATRGRFGI